MRLSEVEGARRPVDEEDVDIDLEYAEDYYYERECGYTIIRMLRGRTTGRKLKRVLWKCCCYQIVCGFFLMVITSNASYNMDLFPFYMIKHPGMGARLYDLMWLICFPAILQGVWGMLMIRFWASLCTNRLILKTMLRLFMFTSMFQFIWVLWGTCVLFLVFKHVNWLDASNMKKLFSYLFFSALFDLPYLFSIVLDFSFYMEELSYYEAQILEPEPPEFDLSGLSFSGLIVKLCAVPVAYGLQLYDLSTATYRSIQRYIAYRRRKQAEQSDASYGGAAQSKKKKGLRHRITKTITRTMRNLHEKLMIQEITEYLFTKKSKRSSVYKDEEKALQDELYNLQKDKEEQDRLESERLQLDLERRSSKLKDAQREEALKFQREEEERLRLQELEDMNTATVLTVNNFKHLWGTLETSGSFSCKLKSTPTSSLLRNHLEKNGFHVVFVTENAGSRDIELGLCNIRENTTNGEWFCARFLVNNDTFTAVMKCQNTDITTYVKKFALAKILKIE